MRINNELDGKRVVLYLVDPLSGGDVGKIEFLPLDGVHAMIRFEREDDGKVIWYTYQAIESIRPLE